LFKRLLVEVRILVKVVVSKAEEEAAIKLHLGEAVGKEVAVALVVVLAEVLLDMEKDSLMMEEERRRPFLLLVRQTHPLGF
jgi:hypothetical protein